MNPPDWCDFASEFYIVEKKVEVVVSINGTAESVRIEALQNARSGRYSTRAYIQDSFTIQPTYPQTRGQFDREPAEVELWADYDLPWTDGDSADDVLLQALGFLDEQCQ